MVITTVGLSHHGDKGTYLQIEERPLGALILEEIGEEWIPRLTGHFLCCSTPQWTYKVRWGKADEDGWTDKSLGSCLWRLGQWMTLGFGAWRESTRIAEIPVTPDWVRKHFPDAGWPWDGSEADDDGNIPPVKEGTQQDGH